MDYKGYCLWADDVPNPKAPHYIAYDTEAQRKICGDELEKVKVFLESRL